MKFYGTGLIWDKDKNNVMCEFKKTGLREGELETQDNVLIKKSPIFIKKSISGCIFVINTFSLSMAGANAAAISSEYL